MPGDASYDTGVYVKQDRFVVGGTGRLAAGTGTGAQTPTTGTLAAHITSATLAGNDFAGTISILNDGTGTAANVNIFVVTFSVARLVIPAVFLSNLTPGAGSVTTYPGSYGAVVTLAGFTVQCLSAMTLSSTVLLGYMVVDQE